MRKTTAVLVVVMVMVQMFCVPVLSYGEEEPSGRPSYQERAAHTFMNAARVDPLGYKATYMSGYGDNTANLFATSTYKIVPPLYYDSNLTNVANLHSADMATNNCFQHNSCNGTPTFTRIGLYYTCPGAKAENIAAGNKDALDSISQWLCDSVNGACAVDNSPNDGHRKNIMSASYKVAGNGYATKAGSQWTHYWTQDFGGGSCNKYTSPVYGGTHRVTKSPAQTKFFAIYYTNPAVAPSSAIVNIDGTDYSLTREIGVEGNGVYVFSQSSGTGCRNYYFKFGSVRYPDTGFLVTYGEGSCVTSFVASSSSSSVSSTATTSSSTSSTPSSTSSIASTSSTASTPSTSSTASTSATTSVASSSVSSSTTTTTTTRPVSTSTASTSSVSTTSGTTGSSGRYVIYSSGLKDSWTLYTNRGATTNAAVSFAGRTAIRADLTGASGTNFFMLRRTPTVPNVYSTIKFSVAAADANTKLFFYVNGGYAKSYTLTSSWTDVSVSLAKTSVGVDLPNLGNPVFVFSNGESTAETFYISEIYVE